MNVLRLFALVLALAVAGCSGSQPPAPVGPPPVPADDNLNATLWTQTSAEYAALARQTYTNARLQLDRALEDPRWTALPEQRTQTGYPLLPTAVVLDVDETVLDNSAYQARLVEAGAVYGRDTWQDWVREAQADAIPGARAFLNYADSLGVTVIYLTNRRGETEDATRANLEAVGFPIDDERAAGDAVLTRGERPTWDTSDKTPRRAYLQERFRVALLVGDNLGDFLGEVETSVAERRELVEAYEDFWGQQWIVLPNPQYGSWEGALFGFDYSLTPEERRRVKREALDLKGGTVPSPVPPVPPQQ